MAQTSVKLIIKDFKAVREVASLSYSFSQTIDKDGQVTDIPRGGLIVLRLKARNDGNREMLDWMIQKKYSKNGMIVFSKTTDGGIMKTLSFTDAYCVNYEEHWEDDTVGIPLAHWEEITISCRMFQNEEVTYTNDWTSMFEGLDLSDY